MSLKQTNNQYQPLETFTTIKAQRLNNEKWRGENTPYSRKFLTKEWLFWSPSLSTLTPQKSRERRVVSIYTLGRGFTGHVLTVTAISEYCSVEYEKEIHNNKVKSEFTECFFVSLPFIFLFFFLNRAELLSSSVLKYRNLES